MIKTAGPDDLDDVVRLAGALWPEHTPGGLRAEMRALLADKGALIALFYRDDVPVAFAQCQLRNDYVEGTESSPVGYLEGIYVAAEHRRKGIAAALLNYCEGWARENGCTEFGSDCELGNEESRRFHLCAGFTEANRIICFSKKL